MRGRQNIGLSERAFETCPRLPRATSCAGAIWQIDEGSAESNVPRAPVMVDQDVVPRGLVKVIVTTSDTPKPVPQMAGCINGTGPALRVIGGMPPQKLMRAEMVGGTTVMGGAGQRKSGTGAPRAGGHGPHPTPSWAGRARHGRSAADEPEPDCGVGAAVAAVDGTVFDARAALFWAAEIGLELNSVREEVVEQAARTNAASKTAGRTDLFWPRPRRASAFSITQIQRSSRAAPTGSDKFRFNFHGASPKRHLT
jgi:hypothetical protein